MTDTYGNSNNRKKSLKFINSNNHKVYNRNREERGSKIKITCVPQEDTLRGKKTVIESIINEHFYKMKK